MYLNILTHYTQVDGLIETTRGAQYVGTELTRLTFPLEVIHHLE